MLLAYREEKYIESEGKFYDAITRGRELVKIITVNDMKEFTIAYNVARKFHPRKYLPNSYKRSKSTSYLSILDRRNVPSYVDNASE